MWKWGWKCESNLLFFSFVFFSPTSPSPIQHRITSNDREWWRRGKMAAHRRETHNRKTKKNRRKNSSRHRNEQQHFILWDVDFLEEDNDGFFLHHVVVVVVEMKKSFTRKSTQKNTNLSLNRLSFATFLPPLSLSPHDKMNGRNSPRHSGACCVEVKWSWILQCVWCWEQEMMMMR